MGVPQRKSRTEPSIEAAVHGAVNLLLRVCIKLSIGVK